MKAKIPLILLCLTLFPAAGIQAANQELQPQSNLVAPRGEEAEPRVSRSQASDIARDSFPGKVVSIRRDNGNWRIRMDEEGTVSDVLVDTQSGRVSRSSDRD